jgi:hypothetical protein
MISALFRLQEIANYDIPAYPYQRQIDATGCQSYVPASEGNRKLWLEHHDARFA